MLESVFLYSALLGGIFFAIQVVMVLLGGDVDDVGEAADGAEIGDVDFEDGFDGDASDADETVGGESHMFYEMFSLRTLAAAVLFFGLIGLAVKRSGGNDVQAITLGVAAGIAALYAVFWMYRWLFRLQSSGTENVRNAIGRPAQVYVPIEPERSAPGKVHLSMQGRMVEYSAITDESHRLGTGDNVVVIDVVNQGTLLVGRDQAAVG